MLDLSDRGGRAARDDDVAAAHEQVQVHHRVEGIVGRGGARAVRSEQRQIRLESATLARKDYNVALEFLEMTPDTTVAIRCSIYTY